VVSRVIDKTIVDIRIPGNDDFAFKKADSIANDIKTISTKSTQERSKPGSSI